MPQRFYKHVSVLDPRGACGERIVRPPRHDWNRRGGVLRRAPDNMARSVNQCNLVAARPRSSRAVPADVFLPLAGHAKAAVLGFVCTDLNNMRECFMLMIVAVVVVVLVAALLAVAASKPDNFQVQRSTTIVAPPETIYPLISNWQNFLAWSPFEKDPAMKRN